MRIEEIEIGTYVIHMCFYADVYQKREGFIYKVDSNKMRCHFHIEQALPETDLYKGDNCWFEQSDIDEGFIEIYDKIKYPEYYL